MKYKVLNASFFALVGFMGHLQSSTFVIAHVGNATAELPLQCGIKAISYIFVYDFWCCCCFWTPLIWIDFKACTTTLSTTSTVLIMAKKFLYTFNIRSQIFFAFKPSIVETTVTRRYWMVCKQRNNWQIEMKLHTLSYEESEPE